MTVSLRRRLLTGVVIGTGVLLGIFCVLLYGVTRRSLVKSFDESLLTSARLLSAVIESEGLESDSEDEHYDAEEIEVKSDGGQGKFGFEFAVDMTPEFNDLNGGAYYQFWNHDKSVVIRSPSLGQSDLPYFVSSSDGPVYQRYEFGDGKTGRAVSYRFTPRVEEGGDIEGSSLVLVVGRDASELYEFLGFFRWLLVNCSIVIVVLSTVVASVVTRTGLRPVHLLAKEIESVDGDALDKTFSAESYPVELVGICECLNGLMARIRSSFERERRFNADVAHELRTPLAGIQSTIEVCLTRSRERGEYEDTLGSCLEIAEGMGRLVNTLLALSRLESEQISLDIQSINLTGMIDDCRGVFADKVNDKKLTFENLVGDDVCCACDKDHLRMIVSNILDNAVEYCDGGGSIRVEAEMIGDSIILLVSNPCCGFCDEDVSRVFDFFWRGDAARTDTGMHCGIGLAVVRKVSEVLGVKVEAGVRDGIFTIGLTLRV